MSVKHRFLWFAVAVATGTSSVAATSPMAVGTNFWDVQYGVNGGSDPFTAGHNNVSGENPWKPAFLAEIAPYAAFRFMDFNQTNNPLREGWKSGKWADRVQKSARRQVPMAYEWQIDLCNRANRDMWLCVVHMADDDHVRNLANLVLTTLKPNLKCYVEWSNETWNDMFDQAGYCQQTAASVGISESNQWYRGQKYHAYRSIQVFKIFSEVFASQRNRLVTVMGSTAIHAFAETHIACIKDRTFYNPSNVKVDALALAPYIGGGSVSEMIANIRPAFGSDQVGRVRNALAGTGIQLMGYEGGKDYYSSQGVADNDPGLRQFYTAYLDTCAKYFTVFMHYAHAGYPWGALEAIGSNPASCPKYTAIVNWIAAHPQPLAVAQCPSATASAIAATGTPPVLFLLNGRSLAPEGVPVGRAGGLPAAGARSYALNGAVTILPPAGSAQ